MERCGLPWGARSSFEKAHGGEAPPRLQVIGFNVCAPNAETKQGLDIMKPSPSPSPPKPASSPRSALQQLLLNQSLPSTSPPSPNPSLPHDLLLLPPPSPSYSSSGLLSPAPSPPSTNQNLSSGLLLLQPAISLPASNQNWTSGLRQPPSAYQSNSSSGILKSLLQSENASSDVPANQSSRTSLFSSLGQSPRATSSPSSGNQCMRGGGVSVNVHMINQHNSKPSKAPIKENYEAFFRIKQADDEILSKEKKKVNSGNDAKAHEIKGRLISAEDDVIHELPHVAKSKKSSWLEHPSAEKCKKSSLIGVQQTSEHPFANEKGRKSSWNEEKSKKNTLFMFVVSSPAPEFHHHHHHGEYNMSKDMDFLSSCHLCRRFLGQDEDVFMYSGDKAFCSMECRYQQIVIDERKERCPPPIIRAGASQVYQHTSITTTTTTTTTTTHHPIMINKPHFIKTAAAA